MGGHLLDDAQRAAFGPHALQWVDRALSTEPVDWLRWEAGVRRCYDYLALRSPGTVVRTASPLALARALFLARVDETPGDEENAVVGMVRQQIQGRVDRVLSKRFAHAVLAQVQNAVYAPVEAALGGDAVAFAVDEALHTAPLANDPPATQASARAAARRFAPTRTKLTRSNRTPTDWQSWRLYLGGQWETAWSAYATFFVAASRDEHGKRWQGRLQALVDAQVAGWWWPHTDFVLVCDRPQVVRTEEVAGGQRRLHCADGPGVLWWDGWSLYFWHGTRVPRWVVEAPSVDAIHAEPNVEVRRCGIEALGWDEYLTGARLRLVDSTDDPGNPGFELRLYDVPAEVWGAPARVLLATNGSPERDGTRRRYGLPVPSDMDTAVHAAAWTYGLSRDQYAGLARRT
jgi:Domain of unknown function (DUF6745)